MGKKEFSSAFSNATDASFREWVGAWIQGWKDAGLVQTGDTGQIDVTTVLKPTTANSGVGFATFYLDSNVNAPVILRFDFGAAAAAVAPGITLSIGKSTDGAGTLGGVLFTPHRFGNLTNSIGTPTPGTHLASAGSGYFAFLCFVDDTSGQISRNCSVIVERSRGVDGTPLETGLMVVMGEGNGTPSMNFTTLLPSVYAISYASGAYCLGIPPVSMPYSINGTVLGPSSSLAAGSIGPVFPWVLIAPGLAPWQSCVIVCIPSGDFPGGIFSTSLCGKVGTFRAIPASLTHRWGVAVSPGGTVNSVASTYIGPAIRWEE